MKKHYKKIIWSGFSAFIILGTLNAFVINHESEINGGITYIKGLDEMYGVTQPGRVLATNSHWEKIVVPEGKAKVTQIQESKQTIVNKEESAISEDLQLQLVEVINPKLWQQGLPSSEFEGELQTSQGSIENFTVSLPGKDSISISFAEIRGNVFEYDYSGEVYSGMLYQIDPKTYMVSLTNGPLEGTRMRFVEEYSPEQVEIHETLREEHNVQIGHFGEGPQPEKYEETQTDVNFAEAQMVNFEAQV